MNRTSGRDLLLNVGSGKASGEVGRLWRDTILVVLEGVVHPQPSEETTALLLLVIFL